LLAPFFCMFDRARSGEALSDSGPWQEDLGLG